MASKFDTALLKSLIGILLIFCLLFPFMGNYLLLRRQFRQVRRDVRAQIAQKADSDDLKLLIFSNKDAKNLLDWKRDDEFEYNGEMFDVMHQESSADSLFLLCWPDKKENKLNKKLMALLSFTLDDHQPFKSNKSQLDKLLKKHFYSPLNGALDKVHLCVIQAYLPYLLLNKTVFAEITSPPPKISIL